MDSIFGFIVVTVVMSIIQINLWRILPRYFRDVVFSIPLLAFTANLGASMVILKFAGASGFIGACNLTASVVFGGYVFYYCRVNRIRGLCIKSLRVWKIPILPYLAIRKD